MDKLLKNRSKNITFFFFTDPNGNTIVSSSQGSNHVMYIDETGLDSDYNMEDEYESFDP